MTRDDDLRRIVEDLIRVMHQQAKELERLADHVARPVGYPGDIPEFNIVAAELSELQVRLGRLSQPAATG
jgi:hypothetical protein